MVQASQIAESEYSTLNPPDPGEIEEVYAAATFDEAARDMRPLARRKTDYIILYHPDRDNPSSVYIVPMNANERRLVIGQLLAKQKVVQGTPIRWNYPRPQVEPRELPLRCFIAGCERRGGFQTRVQLIGHVTGKHSSEAPLYQRLIDGLMEQIYKDIPAEQYELYGLKPPENEAAEMAALDGTREAVNQRRAAAGAKMFVCDICDMSVSAIGLHKFNVHGIRKGE